MGIEEREEMARAGRGKVVNRGLKYPKIFIYIPSHVANDSNFPFKLEEYVTVQIEKGKLVIKKFPGRKKK